MVECTYCVGLKWGIPGYTKPIVLLAPSRPDGTSISRSAQIVVRPYIFRSSHAFSVFGLLSYVSIQTSLHYHQWCASPLETKAYGNRLGSAPISAITSHCRRLPQRQAGVALQLNAEIALSQRNDEKNGIMLMFVTKNA